MGLRLSRLRVSTEPLPSPPVPSRPVPSRPFPSVPRAAARTCPERSPAARRGAYLPACPSGPWASLLAGTRGGRAPREARPKCPGGVSGGAATCGAVLRGQREIPRSPGWEVTGGKLGSPGRENRRGAHTRWSPECPRQRFARGETARRSR